MKKVTVELVLENGELVYIECNDKFSDELFERIEETIRRKDWFCNAWLESLSIKYMGLHVSRINMAKVVALL